MLFSTFNAIFFLVFLLMNVLVLSGIIAGAYRRHKNLESIKTIVLKAVSALLIWLALTAGITAAAAMFFYADTPNGEERIVKMESATFYFLAFFIGWILAGVVIAYLINRLTSKNLS